MKSKIITIAALLLLTFSAVAQPDLTLISESVIQTNAEWGQTINIYMGIKNIGSSPSVNCHIGVYLSTTTSFNGATLLSVISLEALTAGASDNYIQFCFPIPYQLPAGNYYVLYAVDDLGEVAESNENNNNFYSSATINISSSIATSQNLPYPMIFIHGLNSDYISCWATLLGTFEDYFGWSDGGHMNFCLNQDGNTATSNISNDYHDWTSNSPIWAGDFYEVNFNSDASGNTLPNNNSFQSNQAGIVKQGLAIRDAITHVLNVTHKDKVILVGHSMGGLASREYLQNSTIWQPDGEHHVAKLCTIGTPHGGSNQTMAILAPFISVFSMDELSEAVRDLRYSYYSGHQGVYLFGGSENTTDIVGAFNAPFCNVDVNCSGGIGNNITGKNNMSLPTDLAYSSVIGTGNSLGGDGVVAETRANLNNYPGTVYADTFKLVQPTFDLGLWHCELTNQIAGCVQGIDEANDYNHAYRVSFDTLYYGLFSKQTVGSLYAPSDFDDYKITIPTSGNLLIQVYNIPISQILINVLNSSYTSVFSQYSNGQSYILTSTNLSPGQYYFELGGNPEDGTWQFPYAFKLYFTPTTSTKDLASNCFKCSSYPNPFSATTTIAFSLNKSDFVSIKVFDVYGQLVSILSNEIMKEGEHKIEFDGSSLSSGIYFYTIQSGEKIETHKLIIAK